MLWIWESVATGISNKSKERHNQWIGLTPSSREIDWFNSFRDRAKGKIQTKSDFNHERETVDALSLESSIFGIFFKEKSTKIDIFYGKEHYMNVQKRIKFM